MFSTKTQSGVDPWTCWSEAQFINQYSTNVKDGLVVTLSNDLKELHKCWFFFLFSEQIVQQVFDELGLTLNDEVSFITVKPPASEYYQKWQAFSRS